MKIHLLTHKSIRPYGWIIDARCVRDNGKGNHFGILLRERSRGWRVGYLIVREPSIKCLERHPNSLETFEPVKGDMAIALSRPGSPDRYTVFRLDKPVVLKKNVWHDVAALSKTCEIKIFENISVTTEFHSLKKPIVKINR